MSTLTQSEVLLRHLREVGPITSKQAMDDYGIMRAAARIEELRRDGHSISTELITVPTRWGTSTQVARYTLCEQLKLNL